jgi:hypothetical protein
MKITKLTTFIVPPRRCFLKIGTDEGIDGWGEPVVEGRAHSVAAAVANLADYLVGRGLRLGPMTLAANLQLDAVCYNAFIQEQSLGIHCNATTDLLDDLADPSVFASAGAGPRHRGGRGVRARRRRDRAPQAKPGVAPPRRQRGRMVSMRR